MMGGLFSKFVGNSELPRGSELVATHDYVLRGDNELTIKKHENLTLIKKENESWWYVESVNGKGYVPSTYVEKKGSLESEEWFAGKISRAEAERKVLDTSFKKGTFLVRKREVDPNQYALTVRDCHNERAPHIVHYKIIEGRDKRFSLESKDSVTQQKFDSVPELIEYYSDANNIGLCCTLTFAAAKIRSPDLSDFSYMTHTKWEMPHTDFNLIERIGSGNYGEVWRGKWKNSKGKEAVEVAIKKTKDTMPKNEFEKEAKILKQCNHPNLVRLFAVCMTKEPYYIITEFMKNGSLDKYLKRLPHPPDQHAYVDMCTQIANGMRYISGKNLVHRDLAARNILVGDIHGGYPVVKIADFGLTRELNANDYYRLGDMALPWRSVPPECKEKGFNKKSDIWSFGILLYEIFKASQQPPYGDMSYQEVMALLLRGDRLERPERCHEKIYEDVMLKCWAMDPSARPTFDYLFKYFDEYFPKEYLKKNQQSSGPKVAPRAMNTQSTTQNDSREPQRQERLDDQPGPSTDNNEQELYEQPISSCTTQEPSVDDDSEPPETLNRSQLSPSTDQVPATE